MKQAILLAGGKGTRMGDITTDIPKPMVLLNNKPTVMIFAASIWGWNLKPGILV